MRNKYGQVIDCMELFPSLESFYDCMMDLLSDPDAVAKLSAYVKILRLDRDTTGVDFSAFSLFTDGIEFSVTFVGREYPEQPNGTVRVFAYTLLPPSDYS
jgi:hypothetical protein